MTNANHRALAEIDADIAREEAACTAAAANRKEAQDRKRAVIRAQDAAIAGANDVLRVCRRRIRELNAERRAALASLR